MNTSQLESCIKCEDILSAYAIAVFASDTFPRHPINRPYGLIVNTNNSSVPGQHWCDVYDDGQGFVEFFDSYGRAPDKNSVYISRWINQRAMTFNICSKQLQSDHSTVCRHYCILYVHQKMNGTSMDDFVALFSTNLDVNDEYVEWLVTTAFPDCFSNSFAYNQTCLPLTTGI